MKLNAAVHDGALGHLPHTAAALQRAGCQGMFFAEISHDPFLGAAAVGATTEMTVGTAIALAFPRGPTLLAYTAHDLAAATQGRFVLGLGPQVQPHIERRFGLQWSSPVKRMRELVLAIRSIWDCWATGGDLWFEGDIYRLSLMPPAFRPEPTAYPTVPIYLAAVGPAMARLAGEVADGVVLHAFSTPLYVREVILPCIEEGRRAAGRTSDGFQVLYSPFVAHRTATTELAEAREAMRRPLAFYASTPDYRRVLDVHGLAELQPRLRRLTREGQWERMGHEISDEVLDLFCISGGPDDLCGDMARRWDGLADQISLPVDLWLSHLDDPAWGRALGELAGG
jgi:probable F420-dependent oxidoreductase